jgi:hypothetical protein
MDVLFFLKERTRFTRQFYETASEPFREIMRKIDAEEAPYVPGPLEYSEEGEPEYSEEPPFLEERMRAETSVEYWVGHAFQCYPHL